MIFLLEINGAASGNRTRIMSLEGSDSAIELPPLGDRQEAGLQGRSALPDKWTRRQESNLPGGFCRPVPGQSATPRCLVPVERIELPISRLQGERIATVLHRLQMHCLAYREGFEPSQAGLEAAVLPLTLPIRVGGPNGNRTRPCAVTGRYTNRYTMEPENGTP
jgi:hypothetical protein